MQERIIRHFSLPGTLQRAERFGSGLINETYLCEIASDAGVRKYILQRINQHVFLHPKQVMANVETVTTHVQERLRRAGIPDPENTTPALLRTRDGKTYLVDGKGDYWRMFHFIESGEVFDTVQGEQHAFEIGRALGSFQELLSDLHPDQLHDTLPGFHYTGRYLDEFDQALRTDPKNRSREIMAEREFVYRRRSLATALTDHIATGEIPLRVVHNDPKVNNVMVHKGTGKAICMVDLDTVKPGIVHFDFGDCVRSAANPEGEDAPDLDAVRFDAGLYETIKAGYLETAGSFLTKREIELLPLSIQVITFELGIRFLADYLRGDTYFRIRYPGHNLHRARVQFKLLERMEESKK
ncbi:MAG: aminoglycoside phosphotransferase family protein [Nitrospiraceae bacterium]|nr:aminoglycoside phosphotransferase family protein [Nitrospiraceae bacterium]